MIFDPWFLVANSSIVTFVFTVFTVIRRYSSSLKVTVFAKTRKSNCEQYNGKTLQTNQNKLECYSVKTLLHVSPIKVTYKIAKNAKIKDEYILLWSPQIIDDVMGTFVFLEVSDIFLMLRSRIHSRLIALKIGFLGNFEDTRLRIESSAEPKILMP